MWINSFIKDIGLKPYVLPEGITIPLTPGRVDGLVVSFFTVNVVMTVTATATESSKTS